MISENELKHLYLDEHLTMQQIGDKLGCTRQNVHYLLQRYQIDKSNAERFAVTCDTCGTKFSTTRKRYVSRVKHFCKKECYTAYMHNPEYKQWRHGQRLARIIMQDSMDRLLLPGEVVHHIDGDNRNNEIDNLMLFKDHSEHMKHHHKERRG